MLKSVHYILYYSLLNIYTIMILETENQKARIA